MFLYTISHIINLVLQFTSKIQIKRGQMAKLIFRSQAREKEEKEAKFDLAD